MSHDASRPPEANPGMNKDTHAKDQLATPPDSEPATASLSDLAASGLLEPAHCIANALQTTARTVSRVYAEEMRASGLTRGQFPILECLAQSGPLPMAELASALYLDRTTLTRNLRPLMKEGLVEQPAASVDARVRLVAISAAGRTRLAAARNDWRRAQARVLSLFGADAWAELEATLQALRRALH